MHLSESVVLIGIPSHDARIDQTTAMGVLNASVKTSIVCTMHQSSLLPSAFNFIWCTGLNNRERLNITHLCMLHADVGPTDPDWLVKLMQQMEEAEVDVLSAVIPIKDAKGLTSTAVDIGDHPDCDSWMCRRITMREVFDLPEVFTAEEAYAKLYPGWPHRKTLLINTGMMLVDFRKPWVQRAAFGFSDRIEFIKDAGYVNRCESEDWKFARWLDKEGIPYAATRGVRLSHAGRAEFPNHEKWGLFESDTDCKKIVILDGETQDNKHAQHAAA